MLPPLGSREQLERQVRRGLKFSAHVRIALRLAILAGMLLAASCLFIKIVR
jgi:hypothetical protein